ncbi:FadR family transcriptional regulator [Ktedonosporobacter rubrisoli]|uniref:FadR family transcriptional regulator n=1 Tax=Ktedonosporobacter rubrisoli TaxID=2509675 RepID=A0A4P6JNL4_KTERU|nr:FadR/GntR family transcriptional regulator [Ktedonosporobacter rubrisoli]QBD76874.1 FadR family transcriptional regulator [Ktedonosporobacter rubrisoli]
MSYTPASASYRPLSSQRLHEGVVQQIVAQIMSGGLVPGASLPSEAALAQQFGVSRTVIREAVRMLVSKGLVVVKHGSGMLVQPSEQWNYLDPLVLFEHLRVSQDKTVLNELLELRRIVEVEVAALAAQRRTAEDMQTLYKFVEQMRTVIGDPRTFTRFDIAFHDAILAIARNRLLAQTLRPANQALYVARLISSQRYSRSEASERGHEEILSALEKGDPQQAREAMHRHIKQFEDDIHTILAPGFSFDVSDLAHELD